MIPKHYTKTVGGVIFTAREGRSGGWSITARVPTNPNQEDPEPLLASRDVHSEFDAGRTFQAMIDQHALSRVDVVRDIHLDGDRTVAP